MKSNKTEAYGLILILASFGWQIFESDIKDMSNNTDKYQLHEKIDALWQINSAIYTHSSFNNSGSIANINYSLLSDKWKYWKSIEKEKKNLRSQEDIFSAIRIIMFAIGSILVIMAKFKE